MSVEFPKKAPVWPGRGEGDSVGTESPCTFKPKDIAKHQQTGYAPTDCV